jgi:hypothetical protein
MEYLKVVMLSKLSWGGRMNENTLVGEKVMNFFTESAVSDKHNI